MSDRIYHSRLSPSRRQINHQLDEHAFRMKQLLRTDLNMLQQQNALLKVKCKQIPQLQDKVQMVLKHNTQLLAQNQKLSKLANQRKADLQILKGKLESQMQHKMGQNVAHQFQIKKLIGEIQNLNNQIQEIEIAKNRQISDLKNQFHIDLQNQRKSYLAKQEGLQHQIKKFRQIIERKEYQFQDYITQAKRITTQSQFQIQRLRDDKEKLKHEIILIENAKKAEIQGVKIRLQNNFTLQMEKLRRMNSQAQQALQSQRVKLKEIINQKNQEVQQAIARINKQKSFYDENVQLLRKENQNIKNRLMNIEKINDQEFDALKKKLMQVHQTQIQQVKLILQQQIAKLQTHVKSKNDQIQQLIRQKTTARQIYESQLNRMKDDSLVIQKNLKQLEETHSKVIVDYQKKLQEKQEQIQYLNDINLQQTKNNQKQQEFLKKLLQQAQKDTQNAIISAKERQQGLKELLNQAQNECADLKQTIRRQKAQKLRIIQDLKNQMDNKLAQLKAKVQFLTTKNNMLQRQNQHFKQQIQLKDKEISGLQKNLVESQQRQKKLDEQNEKLRQKLIKKDQKTNQMLADQKQRQQNSFAYTLQNLRHDHQAANQLSQQKYKNLQQKLIAKNSEISDLLKMYKKMKVELQHLTDQQANKKDLTLKYPGATSDLLAIKNLFDVFLKTKVLDYCGDALQEKQNYKNSSRK